jgi:hypothetical protein
VLRAAHSAPNTLIAELKRSAKIMKIREDDKSSAYRILQRKNADRQFWRAYILFGIPASILAAIFVYKIDPHNLRSVYGAIWAPLISIVSLIYIPRIFGSDRHEWDIDESQLYFRRPWSGSTKISRIQRIQIMPLKDLVGYYFITVFTRSGHKESIILDDQIYPSESMLKKLKTAPSQET